MSNHEKFKNVAAGIQSLVVSTALAIGGIWTAYTFGLLEDVVSLDIAIEAEQIPGLAANRPAVLVEVTIRNNGSQGVVLDLSRDPLLIQRVRIHDSGNPIAEKTWKPLYYASLTDDPNVRYLYSSQGVQPKSVKTLTFLQELDAPGTYLIRFEAPISPSHLPELTDRDFDDEAAAARLDTKNLGTVWGVSSYVSIVEPRRLAAQQGAAADGQQRVPVKDW